jgi:hypothetical protein
MAHLDIAHHFGAKFADFWPASLRVQPGHYFRVARY